MSYLFFSYLELLCFHIRLVILSLCNIFLCLKIFFALDSALSNSNIVIHDDMLEPLHVLRWKEGRSGFRAKDGFQIAHFC